MVKKISEREYEQMDKSGTLLIDFSAGWCGPCQMLAPVLEEVSEEYEGKLSFYNIDVDENPGIATAFGIQNIPALAIVKNGQKADMQIGFQPKESLKEFIGQHV